MLRHGSLVKGGMEELQHIARVILLNMVRRSHFLSSISILAICGSHFMASFYSKFCVEDLLLHYTRKLISLLKE